MEIHPSFYGIIVMILCKKKLVQILQILHNFNDSMKKNPCANFGVFWSVLAKLWSDKVLNPTWVTSYPRMYRAFCPWFFFHNFVNFMEKNLLHSFMVVLIISHELLKLRCFEWLNCVTTQVTPYTRKNIYNMLILAYI